MPTAEKYLTDQFSDDSVACQYLTSRGFKLQRDWTWLPPEGYESTFDFVQKDWDALDYLIFEWDFGGVVLP